MTSAAPTDEAPMLREAARVVLLDASDRILLFRVAASATGHTVWITPGGGLHGGESHEEAAHRELWEETGIAGVTLGPCVWVRRHIFRFGGVLLDELERFYVVRVADDAVLSRDNWEAHEHTFMTEHRWWATDEIAGSTEWFAPRRLAELLPPIIAWEYPDEAIDTGP